MTAHNNKRKTTAAAAAAAAAAAKPKIQRGGTVLKGRVKQQFVEVDPMDVDGRFKTTLLVCILPE